MFKSFLCYRKRKLKFKTFFCVQIVTFKSENCFQNNLQAEPPPPKKNQRKTKKTHLTWITLKLILTPKWHFNKKHILVGELNKDYYPCYWDIIYCHFWARVYKWLAVEWQQQQHSIQRTWFGSQYCYLWHWRYSSS